jgi:hypothetical protein
MRGKTDSSPAPTYSTDVRDGEGIVGPRGFRQEVKSLVEGRGLMLGRHHGGIGDLPCHIPGYDSRVEGDVQAFATWTPSARVDAPSIRCRIGKPVYRLVGCTLSITSN